MMNMKGINSNNNKASHNMQFWRNSSNCPG